MDRPGSVLNLVATICPFSHRVIIGRALKKLENGVGLSILHPLWDTPEGWILADTDCSTIDGAGNGFQLLHQAYSVIVRLYRESHCSGSLGPALAPDRQQRVSGDRENAERRL